MIIRLLTIAGLATFEVYAAIPMGFAFHLNPWLIFAASTFGGLVGVYIAAFLGERISLWISRLRKKEKKAAAKDGIVHKIWIKYGVIGLGFLGTIAVGAPVCIAIGYSFKVPTGKLIMWCCFGVVARCAIFTILGHLGKQAFF